MCDLQVKRTQLYLTTLQMQIHIYKGDLAGAQHQLQTCVGLTQKGAEYRPGFIRCAHTLCVILLLCCALLVFLVCTHQTQ